MRYFAIAICLILSYGCKDRQRYERFENSKEELLVIDVEKCLNSKKQFAISTISDSIEYLPLVTPENLIITKIRKVAMCRDAFFIHSNLGVFQFDRKGMFVRQFGKRGNGPGEYTTPMDFFVDTCKNVIGISHYPKLSFYNLANGDYVNTIEFENPDIAIQDSIILGSAETFGTLKHRLVGINYQMDTLLTLPNYTFYSQTGLQFGSTMKIREDFYKYDGSTYYKGNEENDTVWRISNLNLEPHIYFDMGKYKLPFEYEPNVSPENFESNAHAYRCVPRVGEDTDYIYFNINFRNGGGLIDYCAVYDKKQMTSYIVHGEKEAGMKDDLYNGPDFWPMSINKDYYISYMEPYLLMDHFDKNPQLINSDLKETIQGLSESSNELLIICRKKQPQQGTTKPL